MQFIYELKAENKLSKKLEQASESAKINSGFRTDYMFFQDILEEEKELAREEGLAEGLAEGRAKGMAEGRTEGLAAGRTEERITTAKKLVAMNVLSAEQIAQATGLTVDEVASL